MSWTGTEEWLKFEWVKKEESRMQRGDLLSLICSFCHVPCPEELQKVVSWSLQAGRALHCMLESHIFRNFCWVQVKSSGACLLGNCSWEKRGTGQDLDLEEALAVLLVLDTVL